MLDQACSRVSSLRGWAQAKVYAHIAQSVEHVIGNDEVTGSIPVVGSLYSRFFADTRGNKMRDLIALACEVCKSKNYTTDKNKKNTPSKLQFKKYCPRCGKHTLHKEANIK